MNFRDWKRSEHLSAIRVGSTDFMVTDETTTGTWGAFVFHGDWCGIGGGATREAAEKSCAAWAERTAREYLFAIDGGQ